MVFAIVSIVRTITPIVNGISGRASAKVCRLDLPAQGAIQIIDLKFLDDESLLVLCRMKGLFPTFSPLLYLGIYSNRAMVPGGPELFLLRAQYQSPVLVYSAQNEGLDMPSNTFNEDQIWNCVRFPDEVSVLAPTQMDVQGRSSARGTIPDRICLLGRDKMTYRTYILPDNWEAVRIITEAEVSQ